MSLTTEEMTLTDEEKEFLADLLEIALKETLIEEHRTRKTSFREHILHREELIKAVLGKLGRPTKS
jgi:hypothetical protein